jgi:hypothetical protein
LYWGNFGSGIVFPAVLSPSRTLITSATGKQISIEWVSGTSGDVLNTQICPLNSSTTSNQITNPVIPLSLFARISNSRFSSSIKSSINENGSLSDNCEGCREGMEGCIPDLAFNQRIIKSAKLFPKQSQRKMNGRATAQGK